MKYCMVCNSEDDVKHINNIYVIGSEGCLLCETCRISLAHHIQENIRLASKSRMIGYKNCKQVRESRKEIIK